MRIPNRVHLIHQINAALAEPVVRPRLARIGRVRDLDDLLELWDTQGRPLRWQAERLHALTTGTQEAPEGIKPAAQTIANWQQRRREDLAARVPA